MAVKKSRNNDKLLRKIVSSSYHIKQKIFIEASYTNNIQTRERFFRSCWRVGLGGFFPDTLIFTFIPYFSSTFVAIIFYLFCLLTITKFSFHYAFTVLFNNRTMFYEETLTFAWLKARKKVFVFYLNKLYLIKYIQYKNV